MYRVLLVENSNTHQRVIAQSLGPGFEVTVAKNVKAAEEFCKLRKFDVLIVDSELPESTGIDFCDVLDCPIEYLTKPVQAKGLRARILALVQRFHQRNETIAWNDLELNVAKREIAIFKDGARSVIEATTHEFKILYHLIKNKDHSLDCVTLRQLVWGMDIHISERTIDRHISLIRTKLGQHRDTILSIPGEGYRLAESQPTSRKNSKKSA